jgi:hypothetical protein
MAWLDNDVGNSIMVVSCMYEHQRPAKVSLRHTDRKLFVVAGVVHLKLTSGRIWGQLLRRVAF